jgi:hypothetical protein
MEIDLGVASMVLLRVPPFIPDLTAMTPTFFRARFNVRGAMPSARAWRQLSSAVDMLQRDGIGKADQFGEIGRLGWALCPVVASSGMAAVCG